MAPLRAAGLAVALVAMTSTVAGRSGVYVLKNAELAVELDAAGDLYQITQLEPLPAVLQILGTPDGGDGWTVLLSDYNSTTGNATLAPSRCSKPTTNSAWLPQRLELDYNCGQWQVRLAYSLPSGASAVSKTISVGIVGGGPWAATVASIELYRGQALLGYSAVVARQPSTFDFHPKKGQKSKPTYPGYGINAEFIGAFYRQNAIGLFASVANPFGVYTNPENHSMVSRGTPPVQWDTRTGAACNNAQHAMRGKNGHFASVKDDAACIAICANNAACQQWEFNNEFKSCQLYNASKEPHTNPKFDCGCRGPCPGAPPRPTPAPPSTNWVTLPGYACSEGGTPPINSSSVPNMNACKALCQANTKCVEWMFQNSSKNCWLYAKKSTPLPNPVFDCGCRGQCGEPQPPGPPLPPPNNTIPALLWASYSPRFLQTKDHSVWFDTEAVVVGPTRLTKYTESHSGLNQGELSAFTRAVGQTLLDTDTNGNRDPVRVQVGWDSNDYQIDVGTAAGQAEYRRMLVRDGSLNITHAIYAPFNSLESSRARAVDAWGWEETLWLGMGQKMRRAEWLPQNSDPVPDELSAMIRFAQSQGVKLLAYMYPVLPFVGDGAEPINGEGWLYSGRRGNHGQYEPANAKMGQPNCTEPDTDTKSPCSDTRASLANVAWQKYLANMMISFVQHTGCGGYAFDYTSFNDWRQPTDYAEWRGWTWILQQVRKAIPDIVMDHRQQSHNWGPWNHAAGSYTEPIAGDENPESYGAAGIGGVPTLSTDGVLANNMRSVNYVYRNHQLEPNARIPGFMSHQSERSFPDGVGPGQQNYSAVNVRDFDIRGFKYGLLSSIGTAGLNNVVAMLPARDKSEDASFPAEYVAWIRKWLSFTNEHADLFARTISIATLDRGVAGNGGKPSIGFVDGTASFTSNGSYGVTFLYNPGPRPVQTSFSLDEAIGIMNSSESATYVVSELYPREKGTTILAVQAQGETLTVTVPPTSAQVLWFTRRELASKSPGVEPLMPLVLNITASNVTATTLGNGQRGVTDITVHVDGASGLSGTTYTFETLVVVPGDTKDYRLRSILVNGVVATRVPGARCVSTLSTSTLCSVARISFNGSSLLRESPEATTTSPLTTPGGTNESTWFNSTLLLDQDVLDQITAQQTAYPVPWDTVDMDAPWLGNRLLLYFYITQPDPNTTTPEVWVDGEMQHVQFAYNSRGNRGGGAGSGGGSGKAAQCYLGAFIDASKWHAGSKNISVLVPPLANTSEFIGIFWYGPANVYTSKVNGPQPAGNLSQCAASASAAGKLPPKGARSVLYFVVDDLRPQLGAYGNSETITPNFDSFANTAAVFDKAYTQVAVCSPSRNSFLSGLRPDTTKIFNFINHVRQAKCPATLGGTAWIGSGYRNISIDKTQGAAGECCTECTKDPACAAWTYFGATVTDGVASAARILDYCSLHRAPHAGRLSAAAGTVSGTSGTFPNIVSLPQHFKQSGYLVMQTGKIWHTEEGSPFGEGMPPLQDFPISWSPGCSMADVNEIAPMTTCDKVWGTQGCPVNATKDGVVLEPNYPPLCDKTIADDAIAKLSLAATQPRPFFLAVGFRKPHMPWRFPAPILDQYPAASAIKVAQHTTLDHSVPPIAHHSPDLGSQGGGDPWHPLNLSVAQHNRLFYYASVTWMDSQFGRVLKQLDKLQLSDNTLVIAMADHGWALGEHGQWQKFNNWEVGTRVPLMIRAPWTQSQGMRSLALAELIDVYPTACDLAGIALPTTPLDGTSLGWVLRGEKTTGSGKNAVLSQFARCPLNSSTNDWIVDRNQMWQNNWCEFVDRSEIPWMGYSLRTVMWRYTEWAAWNGTTLRPDWSNLAGVELYDHRSSLGDCFDCTENVNLAADPAHADIAASLKQQLHTMVDSVIHQSQKMSNRPAGLP